MNDKPPSKVSEMFTSKWLSPVDLQGRTFVLTITTVTVEKLRDKFTQQDTWKVVLSFDGATKVLALNKSQSLRLTEITGSEVFSDWVGHKIQLRPGVTRGKETILIDRPPISKV